MYLKHLFDSAEEQQQYIADLMGVAHDWYCVSIHNRGLHELSQMVGNDDYMFQKLASDKSFWAWWINHCNAWDASFIQWYVYVLDKTLSDEALFEAYKSHTAAFLKRQYVKDSFDNLKYNIVKSSKLNSKHGKTKNKETK